MFEIRLDLIDYVHVSYRENRMFVGYGRVSTVDQNAELQEDALRSAGCEKLFIEKVSSGKKNRPQLTAALDYVWAGDTLVVWRLDPQGSPHFIRW
jgi:DNA invertase Pin-like site-specific DNA recombinase